MPIGYSCWDISMRCCAVHCTLAPRCVPKKSTVLPTEPCLYKGGHVCAARLKTQFINITWRTMEPLAAHPSDSKGGRLSCQSPIQEGGMRGEYGRCCLFRGSEMWKGLYRKGLCVCISVCVCVCVCVGSGDRSISRSRVDNKNRGRRVDELSGDFWDFCSVMVSLKIVRASLCGGLSALCNPPALACDTTLRGHLLPYRENP